MINRDNLIKEIAEVINRNSMESAFNDTPDYILARVAVEAMEQFAHDTRMVDWGKEKTPAASCKGCPFTEIFPDVQKKRQPEPERKREYKKLQAFDIPKEVAGVAELIAELFPGAKIELHRIDVPRNNPRNKRRQKNKRKGGRNNG